MLAAAFYKLVASSDFLPVQCDPGPDTRLPTVKNQTKPCRLPSQITAQLLHRPGHSNHLPPWIFLLFIYLLIFFILLLIIRKCAWNITRTRAIQAIIYFLSYYYYFGFIKITKIGSNNFSCIWMFKKIQTVYSLACIDKTNHFGSITAKCFSTSVKILILVTSSLLFVSYWLFDQTYLSAIPGSTL